jgi:hypothetical protein
MAIRGSKLFVGNQSFPYSLAEAMKHPRVLEVCPICPNCCPQGPNGYAGLTKDVLDHYLEGNSAPPRRMSEGREHLSQGTAPSVKTDPPRHWKAIAGRPLVSVVATSDDKNPKTVVAKAAGLLVDGGEVVMLVRDLGVATDASKEAEVGKHIRVLWTPTLSWGAAMNHGAQMALGDFLFVTREEFDPWSGWDRNFIAMFPDDKSGLAGMVMVTDVGFPHVDGPCLALSRRAYEEVGLFDDRMDLGGPWLTLDLSMRMKEAGYSYRYASRVGGWVAKKIEGPAADRNAKFLWSQHGVKV